MFSSTVITIWSPSSGEGHITGGMTFKNGKLTIPVTGRYYVYAQIYFVRSKYQARFHVKSSNGAKTLLLGDATAPPNQVEGTVHSAGVFRLCKGDEIYVDLWYDHTIWMGPYHTFFGAYMI